MSDYESPITTDAVRSVSVMCKLFGRGRVWFDDLYLGPGQMTYSNLLRNSGLLMYDDYPFSIRSGEPLMAFARHVECANRVARRLHRPCLVMLQAFFFDSQGSREPTATEWRNMVYHSLIFGTRGISHFVKRPASDDLWRGMIETNHEMKALCAALLAADARELGFGRLNEEASYALWRREAKLLLLLANRHYHAAPFRVDLANMARTRIAPAGAVLFEQTVARVKDGACSGELEAAGRRACQFRTE